MSTTIVEARPWDLTHLVQFLPAAKYDHEPISLHDDQTPRISDTDSNDQDCAGTSERNPTTGLGDFSKVWQFLGTTPSKPDAIPLKKDYASDGATYQFGRSRQASVVHLSDGTDVGMSDWSTQLQSRQQKKARKKAKKKDRKTCKGANLSESECNDTVGKETPANKASSHDMATRSGIITRSMSAKLATEQADANAEAATFVNSEVPDTPCPKPTSTRTNTLPTVPKPLIAHIALPLPTEPLGHSDWTQPPRQPHFTTPNIHQTSNLIPASIQPLRSANRETITKPVVLRSGEDRNYALLFKILHNFVPDRKHMVNPMNMTTHNNHSSGIHVFIDYSNIAIGFKKHLRRSRNIHPQQNVPEAGLSFDSLALLVERRRPVAKRVLVGSNPHVPAFTKAEEVGYEVNILDKVFKARKLTERQIYFKDRDCAATRSPRTRVPPPPHRVALAGSVLTPISGGTREIGSETDTTSRYAPQAWVEQGVDEILHAKMMESMLDTITPSTIVLATGDAACAEYSSGFLAMVERALTRGWKVELTSWSQNISTLYRAPAWQAAYGSQFKIIELDDFAEELLDM